MTMYPSKKILEAIGDALNAAMSGDGFDGGDFDGLNPDNFELAIKWVQHATTILAATRPAEAQAVAEVERLREAFRIATDALDGLSYIHDGNPSDVMADMPPVDYARHMLFEARQIARGAATDARCALAASPATGGA